MNKDLADLESLEQKDRGLAFHLTLPKEEFDNLEAAEREAEEQMKKFGYDSVKLHGQTNKSWQFLMVREQPDKKE